MGVRRNRDEQLEQRQTRSQERKAALARTGLHAALVAVALLALLAGCGGDDKSETTTRSSVDSSNSSPVPASGEIDPFKPAGANCAVTGGELRARSTRR